VSRPLRRSGAVALKWLRAAGSSTSSPTSSRARAGVGRSGRESR
jgi:hypothetical protein